MRLEPIELATAIATLDALGMPRGPSGMNEFRLVESGGMRAHLRLALGGERASALHRSGRAGWAMGPLLGFNMRPGDTAASIDAGQDAALLVALVQISEWSEHSSPFLDSCSMRRAIDGHRGESRLEGLAEWIGALPAETPVGERRRTALRHLCSATGIGDAQARTMGVDGLWTRTSADGIVASGIAGKDGWADVMVDVANRRERLRWNGSHDRNPCIWVRASWSAPRVGERVRVEYAGRTPEHRGYVSAVRNLDEIEDEERRRFMRDLLTRPVPIARYEDGRKVAPRDRVVIRIDILEAARGTVGRVTSLCGDLAMVRFEGRRRPVPCYPDSLQRIVETPMDLIAA